MGKHMKVWGLEEMTQCRGVNEEIRVMTNSMILKACEVGVAVWKMARS
jgi:hypothetical protein